MIAALRWVGWGVGVLLALVVGIPAIAAAIFAVFYEWNDLRPLIDRVASRMLERPVHIAGDLDVDLGRVTRIRVEDLTIDNTPSGRAEKMLRVGMIDARIALPPLLSGRIVLPELALDSIDMNLERDAKGRGNWQFGEPQPAAESPGDAGEPPRLPLVESLRVDEARIAFSDARADKSATLMIDRLRAGEDPERKRMTIDGSGRYQDQPAELRATLGSFAVLQQGDQPYPLDVTVTAGDFRTRAAGTVTDPAALAGLDIRLEVRGEDLSNLFPLTGIPIPPSPPYQLSGQLQRAGTTWKLEQFSGNLGDSDLRGSVAVDLGGKRPRIDADVVSAKLDLKDLAGFIGASEGGRDAPIATPQGKVLPDKDVDLAQLRAADAKIRFKATRIVTPQVPIDTLDAAVSLDDGTFRVQPASFAIGDGKVRVFLSTYGGEAPVRTDIEAYIERVDLQRVLRGSDFVSETAGSFNGRAKLSSTGTSIADIAGSATGEVSIVMANGGFSQLLIELMGLDIAESLGVLVSGDQSIPVRCIVADFAARDGLFDARSLVFDTSDTNVIGSGAINMREETLDLRLTPYPKDFSPLTLRTPISVQGTLAAPDAFPDPADIGVEGGVKKVVNAFLTVVTGLVPPVDTGSGENAPCDALIEQARQRLSSDHSSRGR